MFLSVFDMFKIGVGPSSSHTMGPMIAGGRFLDLLRTKAVVPAALQVRLYGSLAFTGKGHATDRAAILGLAGLVGSGRTEVARAIFGADALDAGRIWLDGRMTGAELRRFHPLEHRRVLESRERLYRELLALEPGSSDPGPAPVRPPSA